MVKQPPMNLMTKIPAPERWGGKARERNLNRKYDTVQTTALALLTDDFGHWPPKGLDIVNQPGFPVEIRSAFADSATYVHSAASTAASPMTWIGALIWFNKSMTAGMTYLGVMMFTNILSLGGFVKTSKPNTIHVNDIWAGLRYINPESETLANIISHEHWHVIQNQDRKVSLSSALDERIKLDEMFHEKPSRFVRYLSDEAELQARMHTILANAYHQHGVMPVTKHELWAVMASQGLEVPAEVQRLARTNKACAQAFARFDKNEDFLEDHSDKSAVGDLDKVGKAIHQDKLFRFWDVVMPKLYGDMLELYGDRLGSRRMGETHNIQLREIFMKAAQDHAKGESRFTNAHKMQKAARMMDRFDARELIEDIIGGEIYTYGRGGNIRIADMETRAVMLESFSGHRELTGSDLGHAMRRAAAFNPVGARRLSEHMSERHAPRAKPRGPWG